MGFFAFLVSDACNFLELDLNKTERSFSIKIKENGHSSCFIYRSTKDSYMPKISEEKRQARRDQILAASWICFAQRGIHQTSMADIIRESNLSAGAVYTYFKSKDDLIIAAFSEAFDQLRALLFPIITRGEPYPLPEFVRRSVEGILAYARQNDRNLGVSFLMGWSEAQSNPRIKQQIANSQLAFRQGLVGVVTKWQDRGQIAREADPTMVAQALFSFFLGFVVQSALIGEIDPDAVAKGIEGLISHQASRT